MSARTVFRTLALVACPLLFGSGARGQEADSWRWRHFGLEHGLPSEQIGHVLESPSGRAWVVTPGGVAWFDHYRWRTIANPERAPLAGVRAVCLLGEQLAFVAGDELWLADTAGIRRHGAVGQQRGAIAISVANWDGELLVEVRAHEGAGSELFVVRDGNWKRVEAALELPEAHFRSLLDSHRGPPFIQGLHGLYRWDGLEWSQHLEVYGPEGGLWAEAENGFGIGALRYPHEARGLWTWAKGQAPVRVPDGDGQWIQALDVTGDGRAVVAYDSGRLLMRIGEGWIQLERPAFMGHVRTVAIRAQGDIWLGTERGLFLHRHEPLWRQEPLEGQHVNVLLQHSNGTMLAGADDGLWVERGDGVFEVYEHLLDQPVRAVTSLVQDGQGRVWLASGEAFEGALCWDGEDWIKYGAEHGLEGVVHRMIVDRRGRPWFCTLDQDRMKRVAGRGAFVLEAGEFEAWTVERGLLSNRVYDMAEGPHGELWFATIAGLSRHQNGSWRHWTRADGLFQDRVFAVEVDDAGRAWFAHQSTGGGVGVLAGEELRYYTVADGLADDHVWDLDIGSSGWVWATTQSGLSVIRGERVGSLGRETGLPNPRLWPVLAVDEEVWVGTFGAGIATLDLQRVEREPPQVEFVGEMLPAAVPVARWRALAPMGAVPSDRVRTRYRVDAGPWSAWNLDREAALTGLAPGSHVLEVEALGLLGDLSEGSTPVTFRVPRQLLSTRAAAALLAGLGLTALALAIVLHGRQRLTAALRERDRLFSELVDNALDAIYTCDVEGRLTSLNAAAVQVLGYPREEAVGRLLADFVLPEHRPRLEDIVARALAGENLPAYELDVRSKAGTQVALEVSTRVLQRSGRPVAVQSVARDVTRRRELEGQLLQAQKMEAVGQLAGGIAHDFNNMLLVINGYSELLLQALEQDDPSRRRIEQILEAGERASSLTGQLLAFSRKQVLRPERLDVAALIGDMGQLLRRVLAEDIELDIDVEGSGTRPWVQADPTQLQQVVLNLVVNARDEMPRGGKLSIRARVVEPDGAGARQVELLVSDTGRGMDEETRARLFEPFFTTKQQGKGTGLGLSTVYGIVEQSGGRIEVESERGAGATFRIRLPYSQAETEPPSLAATQEVAHADGPPSEVILVVEDEREVRGWMDDVLSEEGYQVLTAEDADQALRTADRLQGRIHLLVTDVVMPGKSGPELARELAGRRPGVKVLYVSGYTGEALLSRGGRESGLHFLQKPFRRAALLDKVREILRAAREERQRTAVSRH